MEPMTDPITRALYEADDVLGVWYRHVMERAEAEPSDTDREALEVMKKMLTAISLLNQRVNSQERTIALMRQALIGGTW